MNCQTSSQSPPPPYTEKEETLPIRPSSDTHSASHNEIEKEKDADKPLASCEHTAALEELLVTLRQEKTAIFQPGRSFRVCAKGIPRVRLPTSSIQLIIPIANAGNKNGEGDNNADGSLAYISAQSNWSPGNTLLITPARERLVSIQYQGALHPFMERLDKPISQTTSQSATQSQTETKTKPKIKAETKTKTQIQNQHRISTTRPWYSYNRRFILPGTDTQLEWRYEYEQDPYGVLLPKLVLYACKVATIALLAKKKSRFWRRKESSNSSSSNSSTKTTKTPQPALTTKKVTTPGRKIAQLLRGRETRTPGSTASSAGNGGLLVIDANAGEFVEECVIIASCIMMLKKEVDRRRFHQFVAALMVGLVLFS